MADLAREIVASLDGLLRDRGVTAAVEAGTGDANAHVDRGQLTRALRNLVTNAIQHSPRRRQRSDRGRHGIERRDPASPTRVRASPTRTCPTSSSASIGPIGHGGGRPGSGIGLTVARELIVANGGSVDVEATGPTGTTFRVTLPAAS